MLEATLAGVGSVADDLLDLLDQDEDDQVEVKAIMDGFGLKQIFESVIPQLSKMTGERFRISISITEQVINAEAPWYLRLRSPILTRASICICESVRLGSARSQDDRSISGSSYPSVGVAGRGTGKIVCDQDDPKVSTIYLLRSHRIYLLLKLMNWSCSFCRYIPAAELSPSSLRIVADLVPFLAQATEDTLALILETIRAVVGVDGSVLSAQATGELANVLFTVWRANVEGESALSCASQKWTSDHFSIILDPVLGTIVEETLETIASSPSEETYQSLVRTALPALAGALTLVEGQDENLALPNSAFELITAILRGRKGPVGTDFAPLILPAAVASLMNSPDSDTIQHGCSFLTLYIRKDCRGILLWQDSDGQTGLQKILALLAKLLDPSSSESAGLFMGDLILHLLRNAGDQLSLVLPDLLKALVNRVISAKTTTYTQVRFCKLAALATVQMQLY